MIKRVFLFFLLPTIVAGLTSFVPSPSIKSPVPQKVVRTIIVDAGHGIMENGRHNGAKGSYSYEDDICYSVSKLLVSILREQFPEVKIVETRPTEKIVALHRRAEIANQNHGDLFICIHVNSAPAIKHSEINGYKNVVSYVGKGRKKKKMTKRVPKFRYWTTPNPAKGAETYIWGAHKNEDKEIAMRENAPMLEESNYKESYGDIDPNSPEFIALSLLKTKQYFKRSTTLAGFVQDEFGNVGRVDRDVRQRAVGIWVLQATAMPSILVETGYITNRSEEDYLNSKQGQKEIANCIMRAVKNYIGWVEKQQQGGQDNGNTGNNPKKLYDPTVASLLNRVDEREKSNR